MKRIGFRVVFGTSLFWALMLFLTPSQADLPELIEKIKPSIVAVGTFKETNSPKFQLRGTGFVVGRGNLVATNSHVVPEGSPAESLELVINSRQRTGELQLYRVVLIGRDTEHDIALLRIEGTSLPALTLADSDTVREGASIAFTGFPIGGALGFSPVTHRGMVSSITPIALPSGNAQQLNQRLIRQLKSGVFNIFQLDATAYPGNSGSPVFDTESGAVIGMINMVFVKASKEAALTAPSGISYAIPAKFLKELLHRMK